MKRLIVAFDGTWNRTESVARPSDLITNVVKIVRAIRPVARDGTVQSIEYVRGVGTGNLLDRAKGGLTGDGVSVNIEQAYHFIANNYQAGDGLYLFGFSRGAFTARSLSGFLRHVGILAKAQLHRFPAAYLAYRNRQLADMAEVRASFGQPESVDEVSVPVRFLGVWDTVGRLGTIPGLTEPDVRFHDTTLSPNVTAAYHALAVHEIRTDFPATLWTEKWPHQTVEQVWFPGSHSDVGGGLPDAGLSNVTLRWMADRAQRTGLAFDDGYLDADEQRPDENGTIHYSCTGMFRSRPTAPRVIDAELGVEQYVHASVRARRGSNPGPRRRADDFLEAEARACALPDAPDPEGDAERAARDAAERARQAAEQARQIEEIGHAFHTGTTRPLTLETRHPRTDR
jgi:hypothetical protein